MKKLRVYVDTSVIGGCLDKEFTEESNRVFELAKSGELIILISEMVTAELASAPEAARELLEAIPDSAVEYVPITDRVQSLRDAYIQAGVLGPSSRDDATHVAAATVARADAIVSWNFRHIVQLHKIKGYNEVNNRLGYDPLTILSPKEISHEEQDQDD